MAEYTLRLKLLRDTAFGRGDGVAGLVDAEVEHDEYGLPFLRGRALKGMLVYECAEILHALKDHTRRDEWLVAAKFLFGEPGSSLNEKAQLYIGNATLPAELKQAIAYQMQTIADEFAIGQIRADILNALTTIRRQTAVDDDGVAKDKSLRAVRMVLRETEFSAPLTFMSPVGDKTYAQGLLAACVKSFRRAGTRRHRGPGLLEARLYSESKDITDDWFKLFEQEVL